jgi:hypothetical protein
MLSARYFVIFLLYNINLMVSTPHHCSRIWLNWSGLLKFPISVHYDCNFILYRYYHSIFRNRLLKRKCCNKSWTLYIIRKIMYIRVHTRVHTRARAHTHTLAYMSASEGYSCIINRFSVFWKFYLIIWMLIPSNHDIYFVFKLLSMLANHVCFYFTFKKFYNE